MAFGLKIFNESNLPLELIIDVRVRKVFFHRIEGITHQDGDPLLLRISW